VGGRDAFPLSFYLIAYTDLPLWWHLRVHFEERLTKCAVLKALSLHRTSSARDDSWLPDERLPDPVPEDRPQSQDHLP